MTEKQKKIRLVDSTTTPIDEIPIETKYCISAELRMQQIHAAVSRGLPTIKPGKDTDEPIAIACFGPSLKDNLEELRQFPKIMSMSGSHDVLVQNGIIPTWHLECDPRSHKADFLRHPHKDVEYLISSCCHPDVFNAVQDYNTKIWHLYGNEEMLDLPFIYPHKHWVLTGGANVGLRAMVLARFFGYHNLHIFGMDCSFESEIGNTHASYHPNSTKFRMKVKVGDDEFITSAVFIEYARQFFLELSKLPDCKATLHGRGLLQYMALDKAKDPSKIPSLPYNAEAIIAMSAKETISDNYLELNKKLHEDRPDYGASGAKRVEAVLKLKNDPSYQIDTVLDYGCGKGMLGKNLPFAIWEYDPAIPGKDTPPRPADLVVCSDVLEHIEPEMLTAVIADLRRVTKKLLYAVIHTGPAQKILADGRNAHLIQKPAEWWIEKLSEVFVVKQVPNTASIEVHLCAVPIEGKLLPTIRSIGSKAQLKGDDRIDAANALADTIQRVTTVTHDGTRIQFITPNETTLWRAETLFTKEPITIQWIDTFQPGETFLDVGANVGGYTVWAAKRRNVKVVAIEPENGNFDLLAQNIALNNCDAVAACMALTDVPMQGTLYLSSKELGGSCHTFGAPVDYMLRPRQGISQECAGAPLDVLIEHHDFPIPNHIKIDVDGFEFKVIAGMQKTLANPQLKSMLIEVNTNLAEHQEMITHLESIGWKYDKAQVERALRKQGPFKGCGEYVFTRITDPNIIDVVYEEVKQVDRVEQHIITQLEQAIIHQSPYQYMYLKNVFPDDFYQELMAALPGDEQYLSLQQARGTSGYPERFVCETPSDPIWKRLEEIMRGGRIKQILCNRFGVDGPKDEVLLIRDRTGYKIGPHTDTPAKIISALFYLPKDESQKPYGTSLFVPKVPGFTNQSGQHFGFDNFRKFATMKFLPNTAFIFAKTDRSFHGVEPFTGQGVRDVYLYDIRK